MMTVEHKQENFVNQRDRGGGLVLMNMRFEDCTFTSCALSVTKDIDRRSTVKDIEIVNCAEVGCTIGPAILEDVRVQGLKTDDLLIVWGALFNRVKLSGRIGKIKINKHPHTLDRNAEFLKHFDEHREGFYGSVEWALDISEARFMSFDADGIPARLFKRDPESQVIVTRERASAPGWKERLNLARGLWLTSIQIFLKWGGADTVLVTPLGASKQKRDSLLAGLRELRDLGVAEPD